MLEWLCGKRLKQANSKRIVLGSRCMDRRCFSCQLSLLGFASVLGYGVDKIIIRKPFHQIAAFHSSKYE